MDVDVVRMIMSDYKRGARPAGDIVDPETEYKTKKVTERFSENLHIIANEPSLALFRLQEHVHKSLPQLAEQKHDLQSIENQVKGAVYDTQYAISAVEAVQRSSQPLSNISDLLREASFYKERLNEESRKAGAGNKPRVKSGSFTSSSTREPHPAVPVSGHSINADPPDVQMSPVTESVPVFRGLPVGATVSSIPRTTSAQDDDLDLVPKSFD
ncbi:BORCS8 [Branchiostoma lanceolatum]|uniref:BORCS8 protein n=1 Tax=Branchiostoma lanceolatum TaxID=7740 RepID=A0A8J9ZGS6_BRALA|nr:BORCS8 [Branchiostoma lanceolatum]